MNINMDVIETRITGQVVYLRLPPDVQRVIDGGCCCTYCKSHPTETPTWDTLAVPTNGKHERTFTVHMPQGRGLVQ